MKKIRIVRKKNEFCLLCNKSVDEVYEVILSTNTGSYHIAMDLCRDHLIELDKNIQDILGVRDE